MYRKEELHLLLQAAAGMKGILLDANRRLGGRRIKWIRTHTQFAYGNCEQEDDKEGGVLEAAQEVGETAWRELKKAKRRRNTERASQCRRQLEETDAVNAELLKKSSVVVVASKHHFAVYWDTEYAYTIKTEVDPGNGIDPWRWELKRKFMKDPVSTMLAYGHRITDASAEVRETAQARRREGTTAGATAGATPSAETNRQDRADEEDPDPPTPHALA